MSHKNLSVEGRPFKASLSHEALDDIQRGTMKNVYRKVPFFKSPLDIALYLQLLSRLEPRTVIEIGSKYGGSALWFADMMSAHGCKDAHVLSIDIEPLANFTDDRITFIKGDANNLSECLTEELLKCHPHPWLVIEDSSHFYTESIATLTFFHQFLLPGDYFVVEDGVVGQLSGEHYLQYDNGPNRAIIDFIASYGTHYVIDTELCDHFGFNATYNPNGWLRRT